VLTSYGEKTKEHVAEYYALLAAAGAGMLFLAQASNLMTIFLALEWFSISLYILCAIDIDRESRLEAGMKYLIAGSFGSAFLLFGSALVYGATGTLRLDLIGKAIADRGLSDDPLVVTGLAMILVGLAFKASLAPFHQWTPDVYQGSPTPIAGFMGAATKAVAFVLTIRILTTAFEEDAHLWTVLLAVLAVASLVIGNLAALVQKDVKRILAYSSVSHAGFMLMAVAANSPLGARAVLYYLIPYGAMSIGAFAVVAARERELGRDVTVDDLAGYGWERPVLGVGMWLFMLGFAGFPLTGGFVGKFYAFSAAYKHGWIWLVIVGAVATAVSLYYYLGIVRQLFLRTAAGAAGAARPVVAGGSPPRDALLHIAVLACIAVTLGSFFGVQPLIDLAKTAAGSLPF
jgi:NADH-quinone oxidoreductase subunit N